MRTLECPHSCVHSLVNGKQGGALEAFATLRTAIRPFPCVISHVVLQTRGAFKGLSTL